MKLELTGSQQEQVVIESLGSTNINYYQNPVLGRSSVAQLLQRRGLMGFSNLVWVSGDWKGLASPFCRLGREFPERLICEPEFIRQESAHATISAAFFGPDSIGIEVVLTEAMSLFSGAPEKSITMVARLTSNGWRLIHSAEEPHWSRQVVIRFWRGTENIAQFS